MIEKMIFNLLAFACFIIIFGKMIKKNDSNYIYILILEFIGIAINFIEIILNIELNFILKSIIYIISVILPVILILLEIRKGFNFSELFCTLIVKILMSKGKNDTAKEYLFKLIDKYHESYNGHKILAELYEKEEKKSLALDEYIRASDINNKDIKLNYKIAELLKEEKRTEEAIIRLQDIIKFKPEYYNATKLLGDILCENERYKEAINVYTNALRYNPGNYDIYYDLGIAYTMINDFQKAKEFYQKAAEINSLLYNAKISIGQIFLIAGELDEAEKYFQESTKGEDVEAGSYYYLAQIAILKGNREKAINYMNIAVELEPNIYNKVLRDVVFTPIKNDIRKPKKEMQVQKKNTNLQLKEKKALNHLSKTRLLVSGLNNDDILMMKNIKENENKVQQREN